MHDYWIELDALINPDEDPKAPIVTDAYSETMLRTALEKLETNDLPGVARCANEAIKQLEIFLK